MKVEEFLKVTGRSENDVVRFSDLAAMESKTKESDTTSSKGDGSGASTPAKKTSAKKRK